MPLTDIIIWTSAGLLLLAIVLVGAVALMERPIHYQDRVDRLLADVMRKKGNCP